MQTVKDKEWFCPLLNRNIAEGYCLDVNYQAQGWFKDDVLNEIKDMTRMDSDEIIKKCEKCPKYPL